MERGERLSESDCHHGQADRQAVKHHEHEHPFYKPLWRRIAIVVVVALWLAFELFYSRNELWIMLALAMLAYAIYVFFWTWPKQSDDPPKSDA
jgi:hypothetical protein